jgi:hypothetical protein
MTENHPDTKLQQIFRFDGLRDRLGDPEQPGCPPHDGRVARRIGRRDEQQATRITRKLRQAPCEALLDTRGQGHRRQPEPACELYRCHPSRQLQQSERVATCLENDPIQHVLVHRCGQDRLHLGDLNAAIVATGFVWGVLLGEPSAELRAKMADSEVRLFTPYQSM